MYLLVSSQTSPEGEAFVAIIIYEDCMVSKKKSSKRIENKKLIFKTDLMEYREQ